MKQFLLISIGQLVSRIGSGLTHFAIGIWVYQITGSSTRFALLLFFSMLPGLLVSPVSGAVIDRHDRRLVMIVSNLVSLVATLLVALMVIRGSFTIWMLYPLLAVGSVFEAFLTPALSAAATVLVPKAELGRASGIGQLPQAAEAILSPLLAGLLVNVIGIGGVILIDVATFAVAVVTLLLVHIPRPWASVERDTQRSFGRDMRTGFSFITARAGLLANVIFVAFYNFLLGMFQVLLTPMVLTFASAAALGTIVSAAGLGMLAGAVTIGSWGGSRKRMNTILGFSCLMALGIAVTGVASSRILVGLGTMLAFFSAPPLNGASQAIWQVKVPAEMQGRVFSARRAMQALSVPFAFLAAGPLADRVFEPLMRPGSALASSVGAILGVGAGRGMGLLCIVLGALGLFGTLIAAMSPSVRDVESIEPDADSSSGPLVPAGSENVTA